MVPLNVGNWIKFAEIAKKYGLFMLYHLLIEREKFCKCKNVIIMWVRYTFLKALIYVDRGRLDSS